MTGFIGNGFGAGSLSSALVKHNRFNALRLVICEHFIASGFDGAGSRSLTFSRSLTLRGHMSLLLPNCEPGTRCRSPKRCRYDAATVTGREPLHERGGSRPLTRQLRSWVTAVQPLKATGHKSALVTPPNCYLP